MLLLAALAGATDLSEFAGVPLTASIYGSYWPYDDGSFGYHGSYYTETTAPKVIEHNGSRAIRFYIPDNDANDDGWVDHPEAGLIHRSEIALGGPATMSEQTGWRGRRWRISWDITLEVPYPAPYAVVGQLHGHDGNTPGSQGSPAWAVAIQPDGQWSFYQQGAAYDTDGDGTADAVAPLYSRNFGSYQGDIGRATHFALDITYDGPTGGSFALYKNGQVVLQETNVQTFIRSEPTFGFYKFGLYNGCGTWMSACPDMAAIYDNIRFEELSGSGARSASSASDPRDSSVDAEATRWTIGAGLQTLRDGVHMAGGYGTEYVWWSGQLYVLAWDNSSWWRWTGDNWEYARPN
jgi:hypothetical protein